MDSNISPYHIRILFIWHVLIPTLVLVEIAMLWHATGINPMILVVLTTSVCFFVSWGLCWLNDKMEKMRMKARYYKR